MNSPGDKKPMSVIQDRCGVTPRDNARAGGNVVLAWAPCPSEQAPIDQEVLTARCLDSLELVLSLLEAFRQTAPVQFEALDRSVVTGDIKGVIQIAHTLKGTAGMLEARSLHGLAGAVEAAGKAGNLQEAEKLVPQLWEELARCLDFAMALRARCDTAGNLSSWCALELKRDANDLR